MSRDSRVPSARVGGPRWLRWFVVLAPIATAVALVVAQELIVYDSGVTGSVSTAWGSHTSSDDEYIVCSPFHVPTPGPGETLILQSGETSFTSPGSGSGNGSISYTLHKGAPGGGPGAQLLRGDVQLESTPAPYPATAAGEILPAPTATPLTGSELENPYICIHTTKYWIHIPGWLLAGRYLYVSEAGAPFQRVEPYEMDYVVRFSLASSTNLSCSPQLLPQGGTGPGAKQSLWDTVVYLYNPATGQVGVVLRLEQRGSDHWQDLAPYDLLPGELSEHSLRDPILQAFGAGGAFGAVALDCASGTSKAEASTADPMAQSVISATLPDGRQFGQFFQVQPTDAALQAGTSALLFTTHDPSRYRVNVGVVAAADGTRVKLTPLGNGGTTLAAPETLQFDEGQNDQISDVNSHFGLGNTPDVMMQANVEAGAAFVYGSVVDGRGSTPGTSDPTTVLPVTQGAGRVVILEVGRIVGGNEFSGSVSVHNHGSSSVTVDVDFHQRGVPGVANSTSFTLGPRATTSWDDAVGELVGRSGVVGALVFTVRGAVNPGAGQGISAIGREFAIYRDGANNVTGTAGQLMPGLTDADMLQPGGAFHFIGLRDRQIPTGLERSHLGLLNLGHSDVTVTVDGFGSDDSPEGTLSTTVRAGEQVRINRVLNAINPNQDGGLKRIEVRATGPVYVLAYRVNTTGDPVTLSPFRR